MWSGRLSRWSIQAVGVLLLAATLGHFAFDEHRGLTAAAEVVVPLLLAGGVVASGRYLARDPGFGPRSRLLVALGNVAGGAVFVVVLGWALFVSSLEGPWPGYSLTYFLNGGAVGVAAGGLLAASYIRLDRNRERLRRQTEQLGRANDRLERVASVLSHDLRNPLGVAKGRLALAAETGEDEHFEAAESSLDRAEELLSDVLELARQSRAVGETEPTDLAAVARSAWRFVDTGDAELSVDGSLQLEADASRLEQALGNLFANAVEHGGEPLTVVRVGPLEGTDGFYVEDDGVGIPPGERDELFEWGRSGTADGEGLGLAVVRAVVEGHGWSIAATEATDGGARFEITGTETR